MHLIHSFEKERGDVHVRSGTLHPFADLCRVYQHSMYSGGLRCSGESVSGLQPPPPHPGKRTAIPQNNRQWPHRLKFVQSRVAALNVGRVGFHKKYQTPKVNVCLRDLCSSHCVHAKPLSVIVRSGEVGKNDHRDSDALNDVEI